MDEGAEKLKEVKNSDIIKCTLFSIIYVARSKTSKDYAWSIIRGLLTELKAEYDFLKYIHIADIENLADTMDDITVMPDFNQVEPKKIGKAIQNIVDIFKTRMGKKAGYFFLAEFKEVLGDRYHSIIKKWGVDLRISEIKDDIYGWDSEKYRIKDDEDTNIAFIEKK